jgi:hypothetical protein
MPQEDPENTGTTSAIGVLQTGEVPKEPPQTVKCQPRKSRYTGRPS